MTERPNNHEAVTQEATTRAQRTLINPKPERQPWTVTIAPKEPSRTLQQPCKTRFAKQRFEPL